MLEGTLCHGTVLGPEAASQPSWVAFYVSRKAFLIVKTSYLDNKTISLMMVNIYSALNVGEKLTLRLFLEISSDNNLMG